MVLKRVNWRRWSGSVALVRVNGGIEKGQWGRANAGVNGVRSDRGLALGQTGVWLWVVLT